VKRLVEEECFALIETLAETIATHGAAFRA
jgi:dihydroneopterin aldolase